MKKIIVCCLCISSCFAKAQDITAAEYFFGADPGIGNGIPATVGAAGPVVNFTAAVPTAFPGGFYYLSVRVKDINNVWSLYETRGFYISSSTFNTTDIVAAEYFFDTDPGTGNGTAIVVGASGPAVNFTVAVPTSFPAGFHYLSIRTKDTEGKWGLFETRGFYISAVTGNITNITAAEYFFDTDPGAGNGFPAAIGPSGSTVNFTAAIPTALSPGFHYLAIRTKDAEGKWGLFETRPFYITAAPVNMPVITAAEYFIDADPGVGNGAPLAVTTPGDQVTQGFNVPVPLGTSQGDHVLAIRVKDQDDQWSLFEINTFTVAGTLPLHLLSFAAKKEDTKIVLNWRTGNEVNTSHFIIERSPNGVAFSPIGNVAATNSSGVNHYNFDDLHPFDGVNFYRLRQVDRDAQFKYSPIVRVLMGQHADAMNLYPNPAAGKLHIEFNTAQKNALVNIYDAAGRAVMTRSLIYSNPLTLDVSALSQGTYWLRVTDGISTKQTTFIKK